MENEAGTESATTTYNILFVCTGNTCRSPMAEAIARVELQRRGWRHVEVRSAGTSAEPGLGATPQAVTVSARRGIDLGSHASRRLDESLIGWADLVLVMSPSHRYAVEELGGDGKVALLGDFAAGEEGAGEPVPDPYGGSVRVYEDTLAELTRMISDVMDRLAPILHP